MEQLLILFESCFPVKGYNRSTIIDLNRQQSYFIPNSLYDLLIKHKNKSLGEVKKLYNDQESKIIRDYFRFLEDRELLNSSNDTHNFKKLILDWETPSIITNAIICYKRYLYNIKLVYRELEKLGCEAIQVRLFEETSINELYTLTESLTESSIQEVEVILPYTHEYKSTSKLRKFFEKNVRVSRLLISGAPSRYTEVIHKEIGNTVSFIPGKITDNSFCGVIHPNNFSINTTFFTEAISHNTCLNRKISIDENGDIKNCPSMLKSFGNIKDTKLAEVLKNDEFTAAWSISKDSINVCRDCEHRYTCLDCRAYHSNERSNYHPLKCNYNPYIAKWKGEEGYRTLAECGVKSDETGFSIDHERIAKINKELWGED